MRIIAAIVGLLLVGACARESAVERVEWPVMGTVGALQMKGGDAAKMIKADAATVRETFSKIEKLLNVKKLKSEIKGCVSLKHNYKKGNKKIRNAKCVMRNSELPKMLRV